MICHGTTFGIIAVTLVVGNVCGLASVGIRWCHYPANVVGPVLLLRFTDGRTFSAGLNPDVHIQNRNRSFSLLYRGDLPGLNFLFQSLDIMKGRPGWPLVAATGVPWKDWMCVFLRDPFLSEISLQKSVLSWIHGSWGTAAGSLDLLWQWGLSGRSHCLWQDTYSTQEAEPIWLSGWPNLAA